MKTGVKWLAALGKSAIALFIMAAASLVAGFIMIFARHDLDVYEGLYLTLYAFAMIAMFIFAIYKTNLVDSRPANRLKRQALSGFDVFWLVIIAMGLLGLTTLYLVAADAIASINSTVNEAVNEYNDSMERAAAETPDRIPNWDHWLYFFVSFLIIPLAEELMFRGVVLEAFAKVTRPRIAILMSAIIFGLLHGVSVQIGYALICGIVLGAVYWICGSIYASYLVHEVFNFFGAALYTLLDSGAVGKVSDGTMNNIFGAVFMVEMASIIPLFIAFSFLMSRHGMSRSKKQSAEVAADKPISQPVESRDYYEPQRSPVPRRRIGFFALYDEDEYDMKEDSDE